MRLNTLVHFHVFNKFIKLENKIVVHFEHKFVNIASRLIPFKKMTYNTKRHQKLTSRRRAVAPVIATLLLVAIAVVGGSIVFVFSQGFFSQAQVSGTPTIESLKLLGYDARDAQGLTVHDGQAVPLIGGNSTADGLKAGDRVAIYVQNQGVSKATFAEVRFAGTEYTYKAEPTVPAWTGPSSSDLGRFWILESSDGSALQTTAPELQPGQQATIVLELEENIKSGRDGQAKFTTSNGAVFVGTVVAGQQSG